MVCGPCLARRPSICRGSVSSLGPTTDRRPPSFSFSMQKRAPFIFSLSLCRVRELVGGTKESEEINRIEKSLKKRHTHTGEEEGKEDERYGPWIVLATILLESVGGFPEETRSAWRPDGSSEKRQ